MIERLRELRTVRRLLNRHRVVGIIGARQVGKTTLARTVAARRRGPTVTFDLEDPLAKHIHAVALERLLHDISPLR